MRTRARITTSEDGTTVVKCIVPSTIWAVVLRYSEKYRLSAMQAWGILLGEMAARVEAGTTDLFGSTYESVIQDMQLNNELGRSNLPPIDFTKLHRSDKYKSGYVGVLANGTNFRAIGPNHKYIGQFPTADLAAWARYIWYVKNGIPYGDLEDKQIALLKEIEGHRARFKSLGQHYSDKELVDAVDFEDQFGSQQNLSSRIFEAQMSFGSVDGSKGSHVVYGDDGKGELGAPTAKPFRPPGAKRELTPEEIAKIHAHTAGSIK